MGDHGGPSAKTALGSMDLVPPIAVRSRLLCIIACLLYTSRTLIGRRI